MCSSDLQGESPHRLLTLVSMPISRKVYTILGVSQPLEVYIFLLFCFSEAFDGAVLAVLLAALSPWLPALFTNDHAVHSRLMGALLVLALLQFPGAVAFALDGALIGADDKPWLARQAVRNIVAFVPLAIATVVWPRLGLAGIWGAQVCWMVMRAWANGHRWRTLVRHGFSVPTRVTA